MKDWSFAGNDHPDWMSAHVSVSDEPLWLWIIGWFTETVLGWLCCSGCNPLARIPLPNWPKRSWQHCEEGEQYTPREWYGDLGGLWHAYLFDPLFQWYWKRKLPYEINIEIGYPKLRELFEATNPDYFKHMDEMRQPETR